MYEHIFFNYATVFEPHSLKKNYISRSLKVKVIQTTFLNMNKTCRKYVYCFIYSRRHVKLTPCVL